ncbi:hypothetical protein C9F11_33625 [Streptomyces sp. YIM 121038]|nr:hypothetical protein C9F11_33625 [Streptomyces sp. YIM 121038]
MGTTYAGPAIRPDGQDGHDGAPGLDGAAGYEAAGVPR